MSANRPSGEYQHASSVYSSEDVAAILTKYSGGIVDGEYKTLGAMVRHDLVSNVFDGLKTIGEVVLEVGKNPRLLPLASAVILSVVSTLRNANTVFAKAENTLHHGGVASIVSGDLDDQLGIPSADGDSRRDSFISLDAPESTGQPDLEIAGIEGLRYWSSGQSGLFMIDQNKVQLNIDGNAVTVNTFGIGNRVSLSDIDELNGQNVLFDFTQEYSIKTPHLNEQGQTDGVQIVLGSMSKEALKFLVANHNTRKSNRPNSQIDHLFADQANVGVTISIVGGRSVDGQAEKMLTFFALDSAGNKIIIAERELYEGRIESPNGDGVAKNASLVQTIQNGEPVLVLLPAFPEGIDDKTISWQDQDGKWWAGEKQGDKKLTLDEKTGDWEPATESLTPEQLAILTSLDYDARDHASFASENYTIKTQEWQGQNIQTLVHINPETKVERIDGMEVTINGEKQWVRGLWYATPEYPGSGGIVIDMLNTPSQDTRVYFAEEEGAGNVYGEMLKAIANQRGIAYENVWEYIQAHDYKVSIRLPENAKPGSKESPSTLKLSPLTEVDFSKPFNRSFRGGSYVNEQVDGVNVPEQAMYLVGDYRARNSWTIVNGELYSVSVDYRDGAYIGKGGHQAFSLFHDLELLAWMREGFVDGGYGDKLIERPGKLLGIEYETGVTVIDREVFLAFTDDFKGYSFSTFELK